MEKVITIDGREVKVKCTALTPKLYLSIFKKDLLKQLSKLSEVQVDKNGNATLTDDLSNLFLELCYTMAKQAKDPSTEVGSYEEWLDQWSMLGVYQALPSVYSIWGDNVSTTVSAKKKPKRP